MKALLRIVYYLKGTRHLGIRLKAGINFEQGMNFIKLRGFCDASYASMSDGRSQISFGFDLVIEDDNGVEREDMESLPTGQFFTKVSTAGSTALS
jgi:hypothetical protein